MNLEFSLTFKEAMSGGLDRLQGKSRDAFGNIDKDVERTMRGFNKMEEPVRLKVDTSALDVAKEKMMGLREVMEGTMLGGMAMEGMRRGFDFVKEQAKDIFGGGMNAGMTKMELNVMAGDKAGKELYEGTKQYIGSSMFGPELFEQDKLLLGFGEKAGNIMKDMRQMGDISMGDPMKMESLTEAMGKTIMRGKFDMMEMRQLATTGFNPVEELHRKTGESTSSLMKKMSDGAFTIDMYRQAMDAATTAGGRFFEMQKRVMETPGGKWKQLTTNISMAKEEFGVAMLPALGKLIDAFKPMGDSLPELFSKLEQPVEGIIDAFRDILPSLRDFGGGLMGVLKPIGGFVFSDEVRGMAKGVLDTATAFFDIAKPAVKTFAEVMKTAADSLGGTFRTVADLMVFARTGKLPFQDNASGTVNALNQSNFLNYFNPLSWLGGDKLAAMDFKSKQNHLLGNDLYKGVSFWAPKHDWHAELLKYPDATGGRFDMYTKEDKKKANKELSEQMKESGDSIIGGGRKQINISFRNFAEHFTVNAGNLKEGVEKTQAWFEEMYLRLLNIIPA
jgi:hypothetical protein